MESYFSAILANFAIVVFPVTTKGFFLNPILSNDNTLIVKVLSSLSLVNLAMISYLGIKS